MKYGISFLVCVSQVHAAVYVDTQCMWTLMPKYNTLDKSTVMSIAYTKQ